MELKTLNSNNKTDLFCCLFSLARSLAFSLVFAINDTKVAIYYIILPHVSVYTLIQIISTRARTNTQTIIHTQAYREDDEKQRQQQQRQLKRYK